MRITSKALLGQSPPKLLSKITTNVLGENVSVAATSPSRWVQKSLAKISARHGVHKPRALVVNGEGETLLDWGDTSLPLALGGLTRLLTLAMVLRDIDRGALSLDTAIVDMLPDDLVSGLCVMGKKDHSNTITIAHLLSHRSGITDYFTPPGEKSRTLLSQITTSDRGWNLQQALEIAKHYPGRFVPGSKNKTQYSATNYLLLEAVLKETTGMSFEALVNLRVVGSLGLKNTYVFGAYSFERYFSLAPLYQSGTVLRAPQALASSGADGGIVSDAHDTVKFLHAFWRGQFFDQSWCAKLPNKSISVGRGLESGLGVTIQPSSAGRPHLMGLASHSGASAGINPDTLTIGFIATNQMGDPQQGFSDLSTIVHKSSR